MLVCHEHCFNIWVIYSVVHVFLRLTYIQVLWRQPMCTIVYDVIKHVRLPFLLALHSRNLYLLFPFLHLLLSLSPFLPLNGKISLSIGCIWILISIPKCKTVSNNASYTINQLSLLNLPWTVAYRIFLCIVYSNKSWDWIEYKAKKKQTNKIQESKLNHTMTHT